MPWCRSIITKTHAKKMIEILTDLTGSDKISIDIGGTLSKLILVEEKHRNLGNFKYLNRCSFAYSLQPELSLYFPAEQLNIHFLYFETYNVYDCGKFISRIWEKIHDNKNEFKTIKERKLRATGGGSLKNLDFYNKNLGLTLICKDEMLCTVAGMNFLIAFVDHEFFAYSTTRNNKAPISQNFKKSQRVFFFFGAPGNRSNRFNFSLSIGQYWIRSINNKSNRYENFSKSQWFINWRRNLLGVM
mmetsp:Transcript_892/g.1491  ORF Transcript_892/g.1491 Transcript_892/m.1491 type:complete len:244 (-) Transcript_892:3605-4336(-)